MVKAKDSHGNACGAFISPAGWRTLAGGSTPGDVLGTLHPGGVPESTFSWPIRPIGRIGSIPPGHPRCIPLIKVVTTLSPSGYQPIIRPENKGIKPNASRRKPKKFYLRFGTHCQPTPPPFFTAGRHLQKVAGHGQSRLVAPSRTLLRKNLFVFMNHLEPADNPSCFPVSNGATQNHNHECLHLFISPLLKLNLLSRRVYLC